MNNSNQQPLVSVILPVYNASTYLKASIDSVLNQTYSNFELIIINDASTDDSDIIISSYHDSRIHYIQNSENLKLIKTLNKGITLAKGKYIARMDADDICYPFRFEKQIYFLENNPEYVLVGSQAQIIDEEGNEKDRLAYFSEHEDLVFASLFYCPIIHPSVVIKSRILEEQGFLYDESYEHAEDYELWTRMLFVGKLKNLDEILLKYRIHSSQISNVYKIEQLKMNQKLQTELAKKIFTNLHLEEINILLYFKTDHNILQNLSFLTKIEGNYLLKTELFNKYIKKRVKNELLNISFINLKDLLILHIKYFKKIMLLSFYQYLALLKKVHL